MNPDFPSPSESFHGFSLSIRPGFFAVSAPPIPLPSIPDDMDDELDLLVFSPSRWVPTPLGHPSKAFMRRSEPLRLLPCFLKSFMLTGGRLVVGWWLAAKWTSWTG